MQYLKESTASQSVIIGPFVDDTDGNTAETGLTVNNTDIRLSKNGGNIVAKNSGGGTHDELGYYTITLDATDTNTVGRLQLAAHVSGALPVYHEFQVIETAVYDLIFASGADLHTAAISDIESALVIVKSDLVITTSDTAAIESAVSDVESSLVILKSDTTAIETDTGNIYSDTTIIASDAVVITTDIASLSTKQDSDMVVLNTSHTKTQSDIALIDAPLSDIESSLVIVKSDIIVNTTLIQAVESELIIVHSDTTAIHSDTTITTGTSGAVLDANAITAAKIADNAFSNEHFADGALTSTEVTSVGSVDNLSNGSGGISTTASSRTLGGAEPETNTYTATTQEDGTYHIVEDDTGTTDIYYEFDISESGIPQSITWTGYAQSIGDSYAVQFYNWDSTSWDQVGTINGAAGTTPVTDTFSATTSHVGTGSNVGLVRFRFYSTDGTAIATDRMYCTYTQAITGIANGSTVTLDATTANTNLVGNNWNLALGGQSISGSYIKGATVTGISSGTSDVTFEDCNFGAATLPPGNYIRCGIGDGDGTFTAASDGDYFFHECYSLVAGSDTPDFAFSGLGLATTINQRGWTGGATYVIDSNVTLSHEVLAGGKTKITTGGGSAEVRGITRELEIVLSAAETFQFVGTTGPIGLSGTTTATVNLYGIGSAVTDTTSAATVNNYLNIDANATAIYSDTTIIASDIVVLDDAVSDIESSLVIVKSDLVVITSDTTAVESELIVVHSETTVIASDAIVITTDIASLSTKQDSDMVVLDSSHTKTQSDIALLDTPLSDIESSLVIVKSDLAVVESDTTVIEAAGGGLTAEQASDLAAIESELILVHSETTIIQSDTAVIESAASDIESSLVIVKSDTAAIESAGGSLTVAQDSKLTRINSDLIIVGSDVVQIYSDTTIISSDTAAIESAGGSLTVAQDSKLTQVHSDLIIVGSDLSQVYSDTTIIASDAVVITTDIASLTTKQDSDMVVIAAAHTKTQSDIALLNSPISDIESSLVIVKSDIVVLDNAVSDVESSLVIVKSDLVQVYSDTTVIASDAVVLTTNVAALSTKQDSDMVVVAAAHTKTQSDIALLDGPISDIESSLVILKSDATAIHSDTTIIASDAVVLTAMASDIESSLVIAKSDLVILTDGVIISTTKSGTDTTTSCSTNLSGYANDQLIGRIITFTSGAAEGESSDITDYVETNGVITFTALTVAPGAASGVSFKIT